MAEPTDGLSGITAKDVDENGKVIEKTLVLTLSEKQAINAWHTGEINQAKIEQLVWVLKQIPPEGNEWLTKVRANLEGLIVDYSGKGGVPTPEEEK